VRAVLSDDVRWHVPGDNAIAGLHRFRADRIAEVWLPPLDASALDAIRRAA
jgi:hypothetical protein